MEMVGIRQVSTRLPGIRIVLPRAQSLHFHILAKSCRAAYWVKANRGGFLGALIAK